jgi:hypothetical protein
LFSSAEAGGRVRTAKSMPNPTWPLPGRKDRSSTLSARWLAEPFGHFDEGIFQIHRIGFLKEFSDAGVRRAARKAGGMMRQVADHHLTPGGSKIGSSFASSLA